MRKKYEVVALVKKTEKKPVDENYNSMLLTPHNYRPLMSRKE